MAMPLIEDTMLTGISMKFRFGGNDSLGLFQSAWRPLLLLGAA